MNSGGGHEKANPHRGKKSPARGDRQREKKAGRKRVSREYRRKGQKETPIKTDNVIVEFTEKEYYILFDLNKKRAYGDDSTDLFKVVRRRKITPGNIAKISENFVKKLEQRNWGSIYIGDDGKTYISLKIHKKENIEKYLELNIP